MARPDLRGHGGPQPGGAPGILGRAVELIDRYGDALEYDLHAELGLDLLDWLRGRHPWGKLLRLADQLPRHSHYIAALYDDDEIAPLLVMPRDEEEEPRMSMVGWSPERELLTDVLQAVRHMHATLIGVNSKNGKAPDVPSARRPVTAVDVARRRMNEAECARITALFSPRTTGEQVAS